LPEPRRSHISAKLDDSHSRPGRKFGDSGQGARQRGCLFVGCRYGHSLTAEVMRNAVNVPLVFSLSPKGLRGLASTDLYLKEQGSDQKVFATKNSRDFLSDDVEDWFRRYNCKVLATFAATRQYVEHTLANAQAPSGTPSG